MAKVNGGLLVIEALKREQVKYIFSLCGNQINTIFDATIDSGVKIIDVRHEQAAIHMADAWARLTKQAGVAVVTAGAGTVNTFPGIATAFYAGSPLVLIASQASLAELDTAQVEEMPQVRLMEPITKWAATCHQTARIPEYISMAFRYACSGRQGPVFLEIPTDVLSNTVEEETVVFPTSYRTSSRPQGEPEQIESAIQLLLGAEKPLVIAGSGVWWSGASKELREFVETLNLPFTLSGLARGSISEDHPLHVGPLWMLNATRTVTSGADVVLALGCRLSGWRTKGRPPLFREDQRWIQVDLDASEIGANRPIEIGIVADINSFLKQMLQALGSKGISRSETPWVLQCRVHAMERWKRVEAEYMSDALPIHPLRICKEIRDFLDHDAVIIPDGGDIAAFAVEVLRSYHPGHWLDVGPAGLIGIGIPFGIAAKLAKPEKQVLVLSGDGSFGFNCMEFDTAIRHNIPLVVLIANNGSWGQVKHCQEGVYGSDRQVGSVLRPSRYNKVVESLGGYGLYVERPEELAPALQEAFASGLPACINVKTDPAVTSPLTKSVIKGQLALARQSKG